MKDGHIMFFIKLINFYLLNNIISLLSFLFIFLVHPSKPFIYTNYLKKKKKSTVFFKRKNMNVLSIIQTKLILEKETARLFKKLLAARSLHAIFFFFFAFTEHLLNSWREENFVPFSFSQKLCCISWNEFQSFLSIFR